MFDLLLLLVWRREIGKGLDPPFAFARLEDHAQRDDLVLDRVACGRFLFLVLAERLKARLRRAAAPRVLMAALDLVFLHLVGVDLGKGVFAEEGLACRP